MNYKYLLLALITTTQIFGHGFVGNTLVKTPSGYTQISHLTENDFVVSYDYEGHCVPRRILSKHTIIGSECITLMVDGRSMIHVHPDHFFYDQEHEDWVRACDLKEQDTILLKNCIHPVYINFKDHNLSVFEEGYEFYDLTIEEYHNYCVTTEDILVHNQFYMAVGAQYAGYAARYVYGPQQRPMSDEELRRRLGFTEQDCKPGFSCGGGGGKPPKKDDEDDWEYVYKYEEYDRNKFEKSARSHDKRAEEHRVKLFEYGKNPDAYDNLNKLRDAGRNQSRRNDIIRRRIKHLRDEIDNQTKQAGEARFKANEKVIRRRGSK